MDKINFFHGDDYLYEEELNERAALAAEARAITVSYMEAPDFWEDMFKDLGKETVRPAPPNEIYEEKNEEVLLNENVKTAPSNQKKGNEPLKNKKKEKCAVRKKKRKYELDFSGGLAETNPLGLIEITKKMTALFTNFQNAQGKVFQPQDEFKMPEALSRCNLDAGSLWRLWPHNLLNDVMINFYGTFLTNVICQPMQNEAQILSTFFYSSFLKFLAGTIKFLRVQRPRGEDIFKKKVLMIPCNVLNNSHWILIAIFNQDHISDSLHPVINYKEAQTMASEEKFVYRYDPNRSNECYIAIFDSLGFQYPKMVENIKHFLREEYNRIYKKNVDMKNIRAIHVDCVAQRNDKDCGVFMLYNEEKILKNLPQFLEGNCTLHYVTDQVRFKRLNILVTILNYLKSEKK